MIDPTGSQFSLKGQVNTILCVRSLVLCALLVPVVLCALPVILCALPPFCVRGFWHHLDLHMDEHNSEGKQSDIFITNSMVGRMDHNEKLLTIVTISICSHECYNL